MEQAMADDKEKQKTPEVTQEFYEKHKSELGPLAYAWKQVKILGITFGAAAIGAIIARPLWKITGKKDMEIPIPDPRALFSPGWAIKNEDKLIIGKGHASNVVGGFIGLIVGGIINTYGHWKNVRGQQLAVEEVNNDISQMKIRQRTDPELLKENDRLRAMLEEKTMQSDRTGNVGEILKKGMQNPMDHAARVPETTGMKL